MWYEVGGGGVDGVCVCVGGGVLLYASTIQIHANGRFDFY